MNDVALQCQQVQLALCPEGGDPDACTDLATCCQSLPPPMRGGCNAVVTQGLAATCEAVDAVLCP
jgi:hypothetical protein